MKECKKVFQLSVDSWSVKQLQASIRPSLACQQALLGVGAVPLPPSPKRACSQASPVGQEVIAPGQDTSTL